VPPELSPASGAAAVPSAALPPVISLQPHVARVPLTELDRFAVLGSDGLYDTLSDEKVVRCVDDHLRAAIARAASARQPAPPPDGCVLARECAHALVRSALSNGAADNVTALVVLFDWARAAPEGGLAALPEL
jgi:serine/threonine protein phosphatase PrpC